MSSPIKRPHGDAPRHVKKFLGENVTEDLMEWGPSGSVMVYDDLPSFAQQFGTAVPQAVSVPPAAVAVRPHAHDKLAFEIPSGLVPFVTAGRKYPTRPSTDFLERDFFRAKGIATEKRRLLFVFQALKEKLVSPFYNEHGILDVSRFPYALSLLSAEAVAWLKAHKISLKSVTRLVRGDFGVIEEFFLAVQKDFRFLHAIARVYKAASGPSWSGSYRIERPYLAAIRPRMLTTKSVNLKADSQNLATPRPSLRTVWTYRFLHLHIQE